MLVDLSCLKGFEVFFGSLKHFEIFRRFLHADDCYPVYVCILTSKKVIYSNLCLQGPMKFKVLNDQPIGKSEVQLFLVSHMKVWYQTIA